jgi:flagellar basal body-associated protein FliL
LLSSMRFRVSCVVVLMLLCVTGLSYWGVSSNKPVTPVSAQNVLGMVRLPGSPTVEFMNDFFIPLKVDKADQRIMTFDLAFELNTEQRGLFMENLVRIRSSIYQIVSKKTVDVTLKPGSMNSLRDEIMVELKNYLGKTVVVNIYFTRYIVL